MTLSRRDAVLGVSAALATAGLPVAAHAAIPINGDAELISLCDRHHHLISEHSDTYRKAARLHAAVRRRMPVPPDRASGGKYLPGTSFWREHYVRSFRELHTVVARQYPERRARAEALLAEGIREADDYVDRLNAMQAEAGIKALRARCMELVDQIDDNVKRIFATRARTLAGMKRKLDLWPWSSGDDHNWSKVHSVYWDLAALTGA